MNINLLSVQLRPIDVGKALLRNGVISSYFHATSNRWGINKDDGRITEFNFSVGLTNRYDLICNMNMLPSLDRDLLESMRKYEGMAIKLGERKTNYPITDYETERFNFLQNLRFWNWVYEKYSINAVYFWGNPHHQMEYVIYALAIERKIPLIIQSNTAIKGIGIYASSIQTRGKVIGDYYKEIKNHDIDRADLGGTIRNFFDNEIKTDVEKTLLRRNNGFYKKQLKNSKEAIFGRGNGRLALERYLKQHIKYLMGRKWCIEKGIIPIDKYDLYIEKKQRNQIRHYLRKDVTYSRAYDRLAEFPDYSKKYIYFALQLTPEETTMPMAGVFAEQYTSIQMIARAAEKCGLEVYVKEHFVQPFRDSRVYKLIRSIPNVHLIKIEVSSYELISHSVAVSTQTGTCSLEAAFREKSSLVTGEGCNWIGMPNVFFINNEKQCEQVINNILMNKTPFDIEDIIKYLYAFQTKSVPMFCNCEKDITEWKITYINVYRLIKRWIGCGFDVSMI